MQHLAVPGAVNAKVTRGVSTTLITAKFPALIPPSHGYQLIAWQLGCEAGTHPNVGQHILELVFGHVHELLRALVCSGEGDEVERCQPRLPAAADEHQDRLQRRVRLHSKHMLDYLAITSAAGANSLCRQLRHVAKCSSGG